jgi:uncharacterized membrane protein YfcA
MSPWSYPLLAAVGFVASVLNVLSGGGSFLTLPVLIFLGLPPAEANGTNRVGVLAQNAGAVWGFHRLQTLDSRWALASGLPAALGAVLGSVLALHVDDRQFRRALAVFMVAATLWTLVDPLKNRRPARPRPPWSLDVVLGFLIVGLYGGFVQAGVGFLVLAVTTIAGLDLVRGNAVKVFAILVQTIVSLAVFLLGGRVDWAAGLALAAGSLAGGMAGVPLTVLAGNRWLRVVVTATLIVFAVLLWVS